MIPQVLSIVSVGNSASDWVKGIRSAWAKLINTTTSTAKREVVKLLKDWKFYGLPMFAVEVK